MTTAPLEAAHLPPDPSTSAFERTLLPGFARWFVQRVAEYQPDVFVPVETKGARLLETVLAYARDVLDIPLRVPVLYTPALAYTDPAELAGLRVMLLDDATNSGRTLRRHRERVERYGVKDVSLLACVGAENLNVEDEVGLRGLQWFTSADEDMYREYLWQLAELVVARGLPPEVDHHVFRLSMRGALLDSWETLIDRLRRLGHLSLDGPVTTSADVISMTLHFPALPGAPTYPFAGPVRDEGVKKVRLFADIAHNSVHVVPMAFPAIDLDPGTDPDRVPDDVCRALVDTWTGGRETVADLLLDHAQTSDAELLFRVMSTATEVDLIRGFAAVLGTELSSDVVALSSDRDLFGRLYGRKVGDRLADRIDSEIAATFTASRAAPLPAAQDGETQHDPQPRSLNEEVTAATAEIANYLKWLSDAHSREPAADPLKRHGMSLTELQRGVPPASRDLELLSRCIDYGLAMTTLVPFTDVDRADDGTVKVRRKYRVSEIARSGREYEDVGTSRQEVEEEVIALIARSLKRTTGLWPDGPVPIEVVARIATVLGPVVLGDQDAQLKVEASPTGPQLVLGDPVSPKTIFSVQSELFRVNGAGIEPTDVFEDRYTRRDLRLDRRGGSSKPIEGSIKELAPLIDASDNVEELLFGWSAAAFDRMGLGTVEVHLWRAVEELRAPLVPLLCGERPDPKDFDHAAQRAEDLVAAARAVIAALAAEPAASAREQWPEPDRSEQDILDALSCPNTPSAFLEIGVHLCNAADRLVALVRSLEAWGREVETSDADQRALAVEVVDTTTALERSLTSLSRDVASPDVPQEPSDARRLAAAEIKRLLAAVRCRAAALAWDYRGEPRPRRGRPLPIPGA